MNQTTTTTNKIRQAKKRLAAVRDLKRGFFQCGWNISLPQKDTAVEAKRREHISWLIDDIIKEIEDMYRLAVMMADPPAWVTSPAPRAGSVLTEKKAA